MTSQTPEEKEIEEVVYKLPTNIDGDIVLTVSEMLSLLLSQQQKHREELIKKYESKANCNHPEHTPAKLKYREPGLYRHTCPACGVRTEFEVPLVTC